MEGLLVALLILAAAGLLLPKKGNRGRSYKKNYKRKHLHHRSYREPMNKDFVRENWQEVQYLLKHAGPSHNKAAVLEADKLLSEVLRRKGYEGTTGEKIRSAKGEFSDFKGIREAHRFRNSIVHEMGNDIVSSRTKRVIAQYQQAFKDLKAL